MSNRLFDRTWRPLFGMWGNYLRRVVSVGMLLMLSLLAFSVGIASAQSDFAAFDNRLDFNAVSESLSTVGFDRRAPARGFGKYPVGEGLTINRINFRTHGGGRFGVGIILVLSAPYASSNPTYNTGTGANLAWGPPNQPGDATLDITLPGGVHAVGADLRTGRPHVSQIRVTAATADGKMAPFSLFSSR